MTWALHEKEKLIELHKQGLTDKEIAEILKKNEKAVESKRRRIGLTNWKQKKWSNKDKEKLKKMFNEGFSDKEIANILGRKIKKVMSKRASMGLIRSKKRQKNWSVEEEELLKKYFKKGLSDEEIAKKLKSRTAASIQTKRVQLRLVRLNVWSKKEENMLKKLTQEGLTDKEIADIMNRPRNNISRKRLYMGLRKRKK